MREVRYIIREFVQGVKNLIRWFPIIWKDRDWDHHFIYEILKFKLKNQSEYIGYHDRHLSAKRDAEIMMVCVRLIERLQEEYYGCEYQKYHKTDLKFIDSETHPGSYEMEIDQISEDFDSYFKKYPRIYKQVMETEGLPFQKISKRGIAINIAHINEERANKLLYKILENNLRRWWD